MISFFTIKNFLKNKIISKTLFILFLLLLCLAIFSAIKNNIYANKKLDLKTHSELITEYSKISEPNYEEEGITTFDFTNNSCNIKVLLYGIDLIEKLEYKVTLNTLPLAIKIKEDEKQEASCLKFAIETITLSFKSKKTKQEFKKLSRNMVKEFKKHSKSKRKFFGKTILMKAENGVLIFTIN